MIDCNYERMTGFQFIPIHCLWIILISNFWCVSEKGVYLKKMSIDINGVHITVE